jgi:CspA family cold shock protein
MSNTVTGTVKWFNKLKVLVSFNKNLSPTNVLLTFAKIASSGFKTLHEGQQVSFSIEQGQKGPNAVNIVAL